MNRIDGMAWRNHEEASSLREQAGICKRAAQRSARDFPRNQVTLGRMQANSVGRRERRTHFAIEMDIVE